MNRITFIRSASFAAALTMASGALWAQNTPNEDPATRSPTTVQPATPPETGERDPKMRDLTRLLGDWNVTARIFSGADETPIELTGKSHREWALNGQFIHEEFNGDAGTLRTPRDRGVPNPPAGQNNAMKGPMEGMGLIGFDREHNKYAFFWADAYSKSMSLLYGNYDVNAKTFTFDTDSRGLMVPAIYGTDEPGDPSRVRPRRDADDITDDADDVDIDVTDEDTDVDVDVDDPTARDRDAADRPAGRQDPDRRTPAIGRDTPRAGMGEVEVTLRIINENQHVIEIVKGQPNTPGMERMEITYTKAQ